MNKLDRYFVIYPYSYFGESTRDLRLNSDFDILCINPRFYIRLGTELEVSKNKKSVICTIRNISAINNRFKHSTMNTLKSLRMWNKSDTPVFLCSNKVANILELDVDGDIVFIKEA